MEKTNIVVVIFDTLRARDTGCYGNAAVKTPAIDRLAGEGVMFENAFPESLPTIPVRRAIYTGRRSYPFRDYRPLPWGTVYMPGWQPIASGEDTLAENLASLGYQTGYACTTQHCWNPGFNFWRGFRQWEFVRGYSGEDRWKSPFGVTGKDLEKYGDPDELMKSPHSGGGAPMVLANRGVEMKDEETATAKAFRWASEFVEDNSSHPFFLLIDSFAPHEPWEAPAKYYEMYGDRNYRGARHLVPVYGRADRYSASEIAYMRAQYMGLITHADRWFGEFMNSMENLGLLRKTAVLLISDHGTNFCENPSNIIGKPSWSMYPALMKIPLIIRPPGGTAGPKTASELVYNTDLSATVYDFARTAAHEKIHGRSLLPLILNSGGWRKRNFITCRYANDFFYTDGRIWALGDIDGNCRECFDIEKDPECAVPLSGREAAAGWERAWEAILADADGELPDYRGHEFTDALGRGRRK